MKKFKARQIYLLFMLILSVFLITGCGGGGEVQTGHWLPPGDTGVPGTTPPGAVIPGACTVTGATIPTVTSSDPTSGNQNVTTSTAGETGGGKLIIAFFSLAMDPLTIESATPGALSTFTLIKKSDGTTVAGTVLMHNANTVAVFTTSAALLPATEYTAIITTAAKSARGTAMGCLYAWTFKTTATATTGQAPINLKTASTYGIFVVNDASLTIGNAAMINGDVGFMSNGAGSCVVPNSGANITCTDTPAVVNGVVHNGDAAANQALLDFNAAYTDGANRAATTATTPCAIVNADMSSAQGACAGFSPITPGPVYGPGLYSTANPIGWSAAITLDAGNDPNAVFIFLATQLTTATSSEVHLANQAQAKNVFWIIGTSAILGVTSTFEGTIIVGGGGAAAITVDNGTVVHGRLFSGAAGTVDHNSTVTVPLP